MDRWLASGVPDSSDDSADTVAPSSLPTLGRYRLIRELGAGGMGRVYLAYDEDLRESVALKVIKPEYTQSPEAEERFKRELAVARRVTHRNVIRIHDMGVADGTRYISMPFVDGEDLAVLLRRGVPPLETAVSVASQVCDGLAAAHQGGVVHRDLKPANIMIDRTGHAYVMDFGLAHAVGTAVISTPGVVIGTADYMSPEQARGEPADHRSDIYALGLILFQLLTGRLPFSGDTAMSRLSARLHGRAPDLATIRPELPGHLTAIVRRCLEVDPEARYQSVNEVRQALAAGERELSATATPHRLWPRLRPVMTITLILVAFAAATAFWWRTGREPLVADRPPELVLAALPLYNGSGDAAVDWFGRAVADIVLTRLRDASIIRAVPADRVSQILRDLRVSPNAMTAEDTATRVREFTSADLVLSGAYTRVGNQLRIETSMRQSGKATPIALPPQSATLDDVDAVAAKLADALRASLGHRPGQDVAPVAVRSGPTVRLYREGVELTREGKYAEAVKRLTEATAAEPQFAQPWSALAAAYVGLRQDRDAAGASRRAVELAAGLPPRERFQILARHASIQHDNRQAIDAYEQWLAAAPDDTEARFALANLYESVGTYDLARREFDALLTRDPHHVEALLGGGRVAIRSGAPREAIDPLTRALSLAVRLDNDPQRAAAHQALGVAYKRLNRPLDALRAYEEALQLRRRLGLKAASASSLAEMGQIYDQLGKPVEAERYSRESLSIRREIGDRAGESSTLIGLAVFYQDRGDPRRAIRLTTEALVIARDLGNEANEALCLNNIGNAHVDLAEFETATVFLDRSLAIARRLKLPAAIAMSLHNLAVVAESVGDYPVAIRHLTESLDLQRQLRDEREIAYGTYELSLVYDGQGKLRASTEAARAAEGALRPGEDTWYPEIAARHASSRALLGDCADSGAGLVEPLAMARKAGFPRALTAVLVAQSEGSLACDDLTLAGRAAEEAVVVAPQSSNPRVVLGAMVQLARVRNATGRPSEAKAAALEIIAKAERLGLRPITADALIELAEATAMQRRHVESRRAAERALAIADRTASAVQLARANYLLSVSLQAIGSASDAERRLQEARQLIEQITREAGSNAVLKRRDLRRIVE